MNFRLTRPLSQELRRVALEQVDAALERLRGGDVHRTRRRLKQLRALLDLEGGKKADSLGRAFRDAGRLISQTRDLEVCLATLAEMERAPKAPAPRFFKKARTAIAAQKKADSHGLENAADQAIELIENARGVLERWRPTGDWNKIRRGLKRSYRKTRSAYKKARHGGAKTKGKPGTGDVFHGLRKPVKRLWAQLRLLRDYEPRTAKKRIREANCLAQLLGDEHDQTTLGNRLFHEISGSPLAEAIAARRHRLQKEALALAASFLKKKEIEIGDAVD